MQVSIETTSGLERKLTVGVPADKIDVRANERLKEAAKDIRINGFRKGKAPLNVVKKRYGTEVRQEILSDVINSSLQDAFTKESVVPAGQPQIEISQFEEGKDLEYVATFEVYPEITLGEFESYNVTRLTAEINEANIDTMMDSLRAQHATDNPVERAAADGDQVNIDYVGTKDGEEFAGGKAEKQNLVLGSNSMIPGFEDGIVGMKAGEQKTLALTFPEDYQAEELKGAAVEFAITLHSVSEKVLPPMDSELIKKFGAEHGDMEKFREEVQKNMERELGNAIKNKVKSAVMDQLLEHHTVEVPKALVANEINSLREQMMQQFGGMQQNQNLDLKSLLPDDMFTEQAERRVALGLIISEIVKVNEFKADADQVRKTVEELAATYDDPEQVVNYYYQNPQLLSSVEGSVLEDTVVNSILDKATVTEEAVSYEEAVKPQN